MSFKGKGKVTFKTQENVTAQTLGVRSINQSACKVENSLQQILPKQFSNTHTHLIHSSTLAFNQTLSISKPQLLVPELNPSVEQSLQEFKDDAIHSGAIAISKYLSSVFNCLPPLKAILSLNYN